MNSTLRSLLPLATGTFVGALGAILLQRSLPPKEGSPEERIVILENDLKKAQTELRAWEDTSPRKRFGATTHDNVRSIAQARAQGLGNAKQCAERADECLEEVALTDQKNHWCHKLSRGQTQRLVLAKTMLHSPKVLILDEPASGLDPLARRELRSTLRKLASQGATIFISSHILTELAEMCTSICVMSRGKLLASGTVDQVRQQLGDDSRSITVVPLHAIAMIPDWIRQFDGVADARIDSGSISLDFVGDDEAQANLLEEMLRRGLRVRSFTEKRSSYEEILIGVAERSRLS